MSLTRSIVDNRHAVWSVIIAALLFGLAAYWKIPVKLFPDTAPPLVNVITPWPGAGASDVEQDLSRVLEDEFATLEGLAKVKSTSQDNLSMVSVEFQYGTDVDLAAVDVQNAIARISEDLPPGAEQPRVMTFSTADRPIYTVGLAADDLRRTRQIAEDIVAPRLQQVPGVAAVDVFGGSEPAVLVDVDPADAQAHLLPLARVAEVVAQANVSAPAGRLRGITAETMLRVDQRAPRADRLEEIPLQMPDGSQLQLGDVATVTRGVLQADSWFSIDGEQAIAVQVFRAEDANTVETVGRVQKVIEAIAAEHPEIRFIPGEESASFTQQSVDNLLGNVVQALVLASVILFLFLGRTRTSLITMFSMPLSYGITFALMEYLEMEFNMVTLSAIILAVGMVVDASVVVLENIVRLRDDEGLSPVEAAIRGTDEVRLPVLAGVATTLVVLVPLLGLPGFIGRVFSPLALTLLIAFLSSIVVALVVVPVLSLYARDGGRLDELAVRVTAPFRRGMDALRNVYMSLLDYGLRRPGVIVGAALVSFFIGVVGMKKAGMDMLPRMDSGSFSVSLETPSGSSLEETARVVQAIEEVITRQPEVTLVQSQAGYEPGMHFSGGSGVMGPTQGWISVSLTPRTERDATIWEIEERVRRGIDAIPGIAQATVKEVGTTAKATTAAPIIVRLAGPDPLIIDRLGDEVLERIASVPNVVEPARSWRRDLWRQRIVVDEQRAASWGQSTLGVARLLGAGAEGIPAGDLVREGVSPEPILVRYARSEDPRVDELLAWPLFIQGPTGMQVIPIRSVAHAEDVVEQGLFTREDQASTLDVLAQVDGRPLNFVAADVEAALEGMVVPRGYSVRVTGENDDLAESRGSIIQALGVSVLAVYLLLVAQFRSFKHPITVMMAVPLSISGVSAALWVAGKPVSMPVMVGLVLLVGTVVNNSIILVDIIRQQREAGVGLHDAIREGVRTRFRPILMTSTSTVVGMIPLAMEWALGAERFSPLAVAVIGGMSASTLLTLVVIPVLYDLSEKIRPPWRAAAPMVGLLLAGALAAPAARAADIDLQEAWSASLATHPSVEAAEAKLRAARANRSAAVGRMLPEVELLGRYTRLSYVEAPIIEIPLTLPTGETPDPIQLGESIEDQYSFRVTAQQPIFAGGALHNARIAARAGLDRARAEAEGTETDLWMLLVESWYGDKLAHEVLEIQQHLLDDARAWQERMDRLLAEGRATELQAASVSLKRAEAEQAFASARTAAELSRQRLEVVVGREGIEPGGPDLLAVAETAAPLPDGGVRPQVKAAAAGARAATAQARATTGALVPTVAVRFGYQYENPNMRYFPVTADWHDTWDASVVATWTLDGGVRYNRARAARAEAAAAEAMHRAVTDETRLALEQARSAVRMGEQELAVAAERVAVAERAVEAARNAVEAGRAPTIELLDRQADLARARTARRKAAYDLIVARERVRVLSGERGPRS